MSVNVVCFTNSSPRGLPLRHYFKEWVTEVCCSCWFQATI